MSNVDDKSKAPEAPVVPFSRRMRDARRAKGLTQADVARLVGCQQSQVSMLEGGLPNKVARETLAKIADLLGIEIPDPPATSVPAATGALPFAGHAFCPQPDCPSNTPYVVGGEIFFRPAPQPGVPRPGHRCAWCGEVLAFVCPKCGAAATAGACCRECGAPLVMPPAYIDSAPELWAENRRREIAEIFGNSGFAGR